MGIGVRHYPYGGPGSRSRKTTNLTGCKILVYNRAVNHLLRHSKSPHTLRGHVRFPPNRCRNDWLRRGRA